LQTLQPTTTLDSTMKFFYIINELLTSIANLGNYHVA